MSFAQMILPEFDHEMANTRKVIDRIPEEKYGWKMNEKSNTLGWNVNHLAELPGWAVDTLTKPEYDFAPVGGEKYQSPKFTKKADVLALFDKNVAAARAALAGLKDENLGDMWSLKSGGQALFTMPRAGVFRGFVLSHMIHHRAIVSVYMRQLGIPVPALYGPSGDEKF